MKIKKVRVSGFDKLYNGYKACIQDNRSGFGDGLFTFLNHLMVSFEIEEFTGIELFYLKKFASSVEVISHDYKNFIEKDDMVDVNQKVDGLLTIHNTIINDADIDKEKCVADNILPIGCDQYHVVAIFKGSKILSITGSIIQNLFKDEKGQFEDIYIGNPHIENRMATMFYNSFYSFISTEMTNIDVITEFITDNSYYKYADSICSLAHINSPFGELSFYGNNPTRLNYQMSTVKKSMETSPYDLYNYIFLTFGMRTTFNTFMKMYLYSPYVIDHENLKITFNGNEILVDQDILSKYSARIHDPFNYINDFRKELEKSSEINLTKFNFIFNGNPISYSVQIPLSDIIDDNKFSLVIRTADPELRKISNEISKLSKVALSVFS